MPWIIGTGGEPEGVPLFIKAESGYDKLFNIFNYFFLNAPIKNRTDQKSDRTLSKL